MDVNEILKFASKFPILISTFSIVEWEWNIHKMGPFPPETSTLQDALQHIIQTLSDQTIHNLVKRYSNLTKYSCSAEWTDIEFLSTNFYSCSRCSG